MSERPRAVVDTNAVVSALVFSRGRLAGLRAAWQAGYFQPLVSRSTATELLRVLAYPKFQLSASEREDLLADYLPYCTTVKMPSKGPAVPECRDPFGVPFLELALVGKADYLVTGDKDLLSLAEGFPAEIVSVDTFLGLLAAQASDP
ncbi:MAG: putative toxin-antitoxin system toxin component, PIN family [Woeseiaceae bacterium]